jgi:acyl transferase domain-containing protein
LRQGFSAGPAGYLDQVDQFDPAVFSILPRDAVNMDPQERLFLETCWRLLESAGYLDEYRKEPSTGVFVGSMYGAYGQLAATRWNDGQLSGGHSAHWSLANRVSYCFDLQGPSFAVDSACSSSLTAVHLACESLLRNECRVAIAGGVNVILHPAHFASLDALNMLSSHGRSMVFDARADGFAPGEGVGAVLLKPLSAAEADGDEILAVIKGSLVNAGGKTGGYTVPNPNAQAQLIEQVLLRSGVQPQTISYVELHGTGTALGDPIEVGSLAKAFRSAAEHDAPAGAAIGSIKANIGHLEGAAGIAGLSKLLMQFKHRQLAPCVHLQTLNPKIDFERSPLHPQRQLQAWQRPVLDLGDGLREYPLRAGLSSFGAGGANAHLILEEYEDRRPGHALPGTEQPVLFLLSAKTRAQLAVWATDSANFIASAKGAACTLAELGYTSQTGRREMNERLAIVAQDHATLEQALRAFASGDDTHPGVFHDGGRDAHLKEMLADEDGASFISMLLQHRNLPKLGRVWVQGVRIDWRAMWRDGMPKRVALPGYPFEHKRYWIDLDQQPVNTVPALREQIVEQRLDAQAYYCQEHRIRGQRWLPGMFYLELVRQATGLLAAPLRFSDVQWLAPLNLENGVPRLSVHLKVAGGSTVFQVVADGTTTHCQGVLASDCPAQPAPVDLQVLASRCTQVVSAEAVYASLHDAGLEHGASFQVLRQVSLGTAQALADLVSTQGQDAGLPTALLDGALQSLAVLDREPGSNSYVPVGFDSFIVYRALPSRVLVWAREEGQAETGSGIRCFALTLLASDGQVLAELGGLRVAPMLGLRAFVGRDESVPEVVATPTHTSRLAEVEVALQQMAARFLMIDEAAVDLAAELLDSGFDSVSLTELLAEVNQHFALDLLPQVLFDCPTLASFARFVVSSLAPLTPPPDGGAKRTTPTPSRSDQTAPVTTVQAGTHESVVAIRSELQRIAAGFLMVEQGAVDLSAELLDSGFDSVSLTELLVEVNQRFALDLMPQILFDLPTLDALAGYLQPLLQDVAVVVPALKPAPLATQPSFAAEPAGSPLSMQQSLAREEDPIAIIGIAARLPQSEDLQAFWAHLMAGDDLVTEVPADRPVLKADPVMRGMKAGFIDDVAAFDARFFKIAPSEAASMDPQQRLFLETAWRAIEDAGYPPSSLAGSATGVFVGVGTTDYNDLMTAQGMSMDGHTATGIAHSIMANRVSYLLDLQGPSEVIDTACSSALVARKLWRVGST